MLPDGASGATALGDLASFMQDTPALENTQAFQAKYSFMDCFLGLIPGSVGETSALMCLNRGSITTCGQELPVGELYLLFL